MIKKVIAVSGGVLLLALLWALPIAAQRQGATAAQAPAAPLAVTPAQISFALRSGTTAWIGSTCTQGPRAMWIAVGMTNNSSEPLTNAVATLSGFTSAYYTLTADPVRYIGVLTPAETFTAFWYVTYACDAGRVDTYTVTLYAENLTTEAQYVGNLTTNTAGAVGQDMVVTATKGSGIAIGQVYTQVVEYGFTANKTAAVFQPTGDSTFADACFRLVATEVAAASASSGIASGTTNQLYFSNVSLKNKDWVRMIYYWQAQCYAQSTSTPWTVAQSPAHYANNYGLLFSTFPTASLSLSITVSVTPTLLTAAGTVTYTVRLRNSFPEPVVATAARFGLPAHVIYKGVATGSAVHPDNSSQYPALNTAGVLNWKGKPLLSYTVPASGTVAPGEPGTLDLIFTADAPAISGRYTAVTSVTVGTLDVGPLTATFDVDLPTVVSLAAFEATPQDGAILITWETAMELDNVGFNLYRSTAAAGPYTQLNAALIPPQFPGEIWGGDYEWLDTDVQPGVVYYYKLEDLDVKGVSTFHGPISAASVTAPTAVKLQHVSAHPAIMPLALGLMMVLGLVAVYRQRHLTQFVKIAKHL